jgi:predicted component of type VI protein secretion system
VMKPKHPNPLQARVLITEVAPDADQIVQELTKDPARLSGAVRQLIKLSARLLEVRPVIEKTKRNAENRRRAIQEHLNQSKQQNAQRRKSIAFGIAARLMQQDRTLRTPRKKSELARRVRTQWPRNEPPPPHLRNLRRWLTEK